MGVYAEMAHSFSLWTIFRRTDLCAGDSRNFSSTEEILVFLASLILGLVREDEKEAILGDEERGLPADIARFRRNYAILAAGRQANRLSSLCRK
jgi:hypothetical protein